MEHRPNRPFVGASGLGEDRVRFALWCVTESGERSRDRVEVGERASPDGRTATNPARGDPGMRRRKNHLRSVRDASTELLPSTRSAQCSDPSRDTLRRGMRTDPGRAGVP